jgi:peptidoglycan/xylan/chitin deacetylase (PgdA/CDA1 family)
MILPATFRGANAEIEPIPILLYHAVTDTPPVDQASFTVAPSAFAEHVAAMVASGRRALSVSALGACLRGERPLPGPSFAVTFDDGFLDTVAATRLLSEHGIASTVFVTTGRMDGERAELPPAAVSALAADELVELGAHTVSHPYLDELAPAVAAFEIAESRRMLQQRTGRTVDSFAYPHGAYNREVRAAVSSAGFSTAAAVKNALCHPADDPLALARVTIMRETSTDAVARLLGGRGAPLAWSRERYRTQAFRTARRMRRRAVDLRRRRKGPIDPLA